MEAEIEHLDEGKLKGSEGTVWYVTRPTGEVVLFKCKPESVEAIHWTAGISKASVMATCWNVFETQDTLTYESLEPLLLEEYSSDDIRRFRPYIDECIVEVNRRLAFQNYVLASYRALGITLDQDKAAVMRALSKEFDRSEMKRVFTVLKTHA
jgi:hypothetical protein